MKLWRVTLLCIASLIVIDTVFLVTNYHVVTGHAPGSGAPNQGDRVVFYLHKDKNEPSEVKQVVLPLYSTAGAPLPAGNAGSPSAVNTMPFL